MEKYYLGLDMGTSTVGWAVTDIYYHLIRKKGKDLWGVREFEEAKTAVERRNHRTSRRRRQREQVRIGLLKDYFHEAIAEVDPNFYSRLENSKYHLEEKDEKVKTPNGIFADKDFTDKEYYEGYPTIFHLRQELIHNPNPHDVRLVFLAILNMYKHRGHFLNVGTSSEDTVKMDMAFRQLKEMLEEILDISFPYVKANDVEAILGDRNISKTAKAEKLAQLLSVPKNEKQKYAIVKTICGLKSDAKVLFQLEHLEEKVEICFSDLKEEEKEAKIQETIGDELYDIVCAMKTVYDIGSLSSILRGQDYLSDVRVEDYKKHKYDLDILKKVIHRYGTREIYDKMFRSEENGSYSAYVNSVSYQKLYKNGESSKHRRNMKGRTREDFYSNVKKVIKNMPKEDEDVNYIKREIELETFMPKQLSASNGVIPYQVHEKEMKMILHNAKEYLPFLNDIDESGLTVAERILRIFTFRIPYYIGPVSENSEKSQGNGWVVRKEPGMIYPWNIEQKISMEETSEKFISRMVRRCTYIHGEQVLPKSSLLYEAYCVLNEINNIKINDERISVQLKQELYNDLFKKGKRVTRKQLEKYFMNRGLITSGAQITGIDITVNNYLASYGKFYAIFGEEIEKDYCKKQVEDIIFWCTVYGESKQFLKKRITEQYPQITKEQLKRILGMKFKDWGRFSKEFLTLQGTDKTTGEIISLIRALWDTQNNLMELLHEKDYSFNEALEQKQKDIVMSLSELTPEIFEDYYFSAPVKKMIWQTLKLIQEIESIMGGAPEKVFIEMTRSDEEKGDKGRKNSRKKQLLECYKGVKNDIQDWKQLIEDCDKNGKLRSKKMYLYLTQMGRDMYTGEEINLDELFDNNIYDIDHIYPRHFVKDDSIHNNLVLVHKDKNAHKSDRYPLETVIRHNPKVRDLWEALKKKGLITEEKYRRLNGANEFSEEQKADFIARQLVETSQATKGIADLLKKVLPDAEIVYAKAGNVSDFRRKYDLLKTRLVNDFHHANDAYLNIVVGNVYLTKFTKNPRNFIHNEYMKDREKYEYHLSKMFDYDVIRADQTAWIAQKKDGDPGTIALIKKTLARNTPMITRQNFVAHGQLADQTLYGHKKASKERYIPIKTSDEKMKDVLRYGGFSSVSIAYFFLVEHEKKGKLIRTLESLPIYYAEHVEKDPGELEKYCETVLELKNFSIRMRKIRMQSLVRYNHFYVCLSGKTGNQIILRNAISMCFNQYWCNYIKKIEKYMKTEVIDQISKEKNMELYDQLIEKHMDGIFSNRPNPIGKMVKEGRRKFENLSVKEQCISLNNIISLSQLGNKTADLKNIGGAQNAGKMLMSKEVSNAEEIVLIHQSVTGIYEKEIDLLKV